MGTFELTQEDFTGLETYAEITQRKQVDPYLDSAFFLLKQMSSRTKGAVFESIISEMLTRDGHQVERAQSSAYDRLVDGKRVEIKGSFMWGDTDSFRWQQIRPKQEYDYIIFLAFYPQSLKAFASNKEDCNEYVLEKDDKGHFIHNQHGGKTATSDTFLIQGAPEDFPFFTPLDIFLEQVSDE